MHKLLETDMLRYLLMEPERLTDVYSWHGHIPYAFLLVRLLRPQVLVELGTHKGDSYCAFCQAVKHLQLDCACFAVDTWEGDEHAGRYSAEDVLEDLRKHHDPRYSQFSSLMQTTFDDALNNFADGSIDLLHIDGCHTYDAVKRDWENWRPKLSPRGVVLFHDTGVRERDFGVWKLWEEIRGLGPGLELRHSNGLGVLAYGPEAPQEVLECITLQGDERSMLKDFLAALGGRLRIRSVDAALSNLQKERSFIIKERSEFYKKCTALQMENDSLSRQLAVMDDKRYISERRIADMQEQFSAAEQDFHEKDRALQEVYSSRGWQVLNWLHVQRKALKQRIGLRKC